MHEGKGGGGKVEREGRREDDKKAKTSTRNQTAWTSPETREEAGEEGKERGREGWALKANWSF